MVKRRLNHIRRNEYLCLKAIIEKRSISSKNRIRVKELEITRCQSGPINLYMVRRVPVIALCL